MSLQRETGDEAPELCHGDVPVFILLESSQQSSVNMKEKKPKYASFMKLSNSINLTEISMRIVVDKASSTVYISVYRTNQ
jgi:hypothetical protein